MGLKTYVLLDHTRPTAPIYQRVNKDQRVRIDTRAIDHPYLQITAYFEKYQKNRTLRLKLNSNSIFQDEQIEKEKMTANEKFTQRERDAVKFVNGVLNTTNVTVQKFLDEHPQFEGFDGMCEDVTIPLFKSYDKNVEIQNNNADFKKRLKVGNKIANLTLEQGQELMIRLNGSFFVPPSDLDSVQMGLVEFMDDTDDAGLDAMLREESTADEKTTILIGKAVHLGILSFTEIENQVAKKKGSGWIPVKLIGSDHLPEERIRLFSEFITSEGGKLLYDDITKDVAKAEKKKEAATA
jgi:hypothetical protein